MVVVKCVLVGNSGVGKTSLVNRAVNGSFSPNSNEATVGGTHSSFSIHTEKGDFNFNVWDTAGQAEYRNVVPTYFQGAAVIIIVFDPTNRESFDAVNEWANLIRDRAPEDTITILVANKIDIEPREINFESGYDKSHQVNCPYYLECSAKTGQGVNDIFELIANSDEIRKDPDYMNSEETQNTGDEEPGCKACN